MEYYTDGILTVRPKPMMWRMFRLNENEKVPKLFKKWINYIIMNNATELYQLSDEFIEYIKNATTIEMLSPPTKNRPIGHSFFRVPNYIRKKLFLLEKEDIEKENFDRLTAIKKFREYTDKQEEIIMQNREKLVDELKKYKKKHKKKKDLKKKMKKIIRILQNIKKRCKKKTNGSRMSFCWRMHRLELLVQKELINDREC